MNKKMLEQKFEDLLNLYEFKQGGEFDAFKEDDVL